jgi:ATP-binding cassette subfamily G (WHITE) protein 2 (PDR)
MCWRIEDAMPEQKPDTMINESESEARAPPKHAAVTSAFERWLTANYRNQEDQRRSGLGVSYHDLNVFGHGAQADFQKNFLNYPLYYLSSLRSLFSRGRPEHVHILQNFEGRLDSGEMLLVLGRPGSGCTTLLKTLAGQAHGLHVSSESEINYQGMMNVDDMFLADPY